MAPEVMSMTGFASVQGSFEDWSWSGDIRAVNGKSLELRLRVPDIEGLEPDLRKHLQAHLGRGNVTVQIKLVREDAAAGFELNAAALDRALRLVSGIARKAKANGLEVRASSAADIAAMRGVIEPTESAVAHPPGLKDRVLETFEVATNVFLKDRAREGAALGKLLVDQIDQIEALTKAAGEALGDREAAQKANLERALSRLLDAGDMPDPDRLAQELALIAVKTDVTEELDRLGAHIAAARALLNSTDPVGRKLDFLMQEFNREANTLCSKAQSSALTAIGLDLKAVIDQMREQVQNIE